jgi:hypothetical protein
MSKLGIPSVPLWTVGWFSVSGSAMSNNEHTFADTNRHLVEIPASFAIARWSRDADVATICRCILGTFKYEPHTADTTVLRQALEGIIEHTAGGASAHRVAEWLNQHPAPSTPDRCAWCGKDESPGAVVVPFGAGPGTHAWLHSECWSAWHQARRAHAIAVLERSAPRNEHPAVITCPPRSNPTDQDVTENANKSFADPNRHLVEVPDSFAIARWSRDADVATIARCILGTLKYEPHAADTTVLRRALEDVIEHTARGGTAQTQQETLSMKRTQGQSGDTTTTVDVEAEMTVEQWLAIRKEAGLKIDPETAEVQWIHARPFDPYGVYPDLPEECQQVGRVYFARSPGSDVWVCFYDLPEATRDALWKKHRSKLAFPAGWEGFVLFEEEKNNL